MKKLILGIDIGTTCLKAVLYDCNLNRIAGTQQNLYIDSREKCWAEQDPDSWWEAICDSVKKLRRNTAGEIVAVCVSSQSSALVCVDNEGKAIYPAVIWTDTRAEKERLELQSHFKEHFNETHPDDIATFDCVQKILWMRRNEPHIFNKTHMFIFCTSYIVHKLTGKFAIDYSQAGISHMMNFRTRDWDDIILKYLGIEKIRLPEIMASDAAAGTVTKEASEICGISKNAIVLTGAIDTSSAALGSGLIKSGSMMFSLGTSANIAMAASWESIYSLEDTRITLFPHASRNMMLYVAVVKNMGRCMNWLNKLLCDPLAPVPTEAALEEINKRMQNGKGNILFLPYLDGETFPFNNPYATGLFFGINHTTTIEDMVRAVFEGCCFALKETFDILCRIAGTVPEYIIALGGPSNNKIWMQMLSDVLNIKILKLGEVDATCGDAQLCLNALGISRQPSDIQQQAERIYKPQLCKKGYFERMFGYFLELRDSLSKFFTQAHCLN